jgi:Sec-independent protein translocase protein TatA
MPGMPVDLLFILIIILVLVLMWKGPKNLPKLGEALGRGVKEARVEASKAQSEIQGRVSEDTPPSDPAQPTAPAASAAAASAPDEQRPA